MRFSIAFPWAAGILFVSGLGACSSQKAIVITMADGAEISLEAGTETTTHPDMATSTKKTLFSDDFDGGYDDHWSLSVSSDGTVTDIPEGSNNIVTFDSTDKPYTRLKCNLDGSEFTNADISASVRMRIEKAPLGTRAVRLTVRQAKETENIFYAVSASIANDGSMTKVGIFKKVDDGKNNYTICPLGEVNLSPPVAMNQWRTLGLTISGDNTVRIQAFFEGEERVKAVDDCVSPLMSTADVAVPNGGCLANQTGIGILAEQGIIMSADDVLVTTL